MEKRLQKPVTCKFCQTSSLKWDWNFVSKRPLLIDDRKRTHRCQEKEEQDVTPAKCKYCKASELVWVKRSVSRFQTKFELTESYGLPHFCEQLPAFLRDYKEALREDYAFEKKRLKAIPDDTCCKKCKGRGNKGYKDKRRWNGYRYVVCKACKGMGHFSKIKKKGFLKSLRGKYWPYQPWMSKG